MDILCETDRNVNAIAARRRSPSRGPPGTGKTEFARALARNCGKEAWLLEADTLNEPKDALVALRAAGRTVQPSVAALIIDEADWILNTGYSFVSQVKSPEKGALNCFLDSCPAQVIWISNSVDAVSESVLRRFSYSQSFGKFSRKQKERLWRSLLRGHSGEEYLNEALVSRFAEYEVDAGNITNTLNVLGCLADSDLAKGGAELYVREVLAAHERLQTGGIRKHEQSSGIHYDPSILNTDVDARVILASLQQFVLAQERGGGANPGGMKLLLWGAPGTGKTAYARHLAAELKKDLLQKRASDLLSCWVGQTEKNIRDVFEEAEQDDSVLLIDEADSFFRNREKAQHSWEVTQTNELLTQMDAFSGIVICCTNMLDVLDHAALRRFSYKMEFRPLSIGQAQKLASLYFPHVQLSHDALYELGKMENLTPGDMVAVWQQSRLLPPEDITESFLLGSLIDEIGYRKIGHLGKIGF